MEKKFSKTEMVKIPWMAKKKILETMELRLDAAIDKAENLARDVEIDCMMKTFDSVMEKAHEEQVVSMVAELNSQYGADIFDAYQQTKDIHEKVIEENCSRLNKLICRKVQQNRILMVFVSLLLKTIIKKMLIYSYKLMYKT